MTFYHIRAKAWEGQGQNRSRECLYHGCHGNNPGTITNTSKNREFHQRRLYKTLKKKIEEIGKKADP